MSRVAAGMAPFRLLDFVHLILNGAASSDSIQLISSLNLADLGDLSGRDHLGIHIGEYRKAPKGAASSASVLVLYTLGQGGSPGASRPGD